MDRQFPQRAGAVDECDAAGQRRDAPDPKYSVVRDQTGSSGKDLPGNILMFAPASNAQDWRVNNFDLLRLLAAVQVVIIHTLTMFKVSGVYVAVFRVGLQFFPGVPIFFFISGFLISKSYEHSNSVRDYYRNRCLRIFPALWVCLVATVGVILIAGVDAMGAASTLDWLGWWAAQMTLLQQYNPDFLQAMGIGKINASLWTIPVELEFYLVLPAIYAGFRLRKRGGDVLFALLLATSLAIHFILSHPLIFPGIPPQFVMVDTLVPYLWIFLVGVLMQRHWTYVRSWLAGRALWWFLGYVLICAISKRFHINVGSADVSAFLLLPLAGLTISFAVSAPTLSDRILRHNDISYGTYIYHMLLINLMLLLGVHADVLAVAAVLAMSLGLGALSWVCIERPFLRLKRRSLRAALVAPHSVDRSRDAPAPLQSLN
jgi:peptidoglycan/LPS O-acetylase OafA/YrhL